jgi:hypothetical protein
VVGAWKDHCLLPGEKGKKTDRKITSKRTANIPRKSINSEGAKHGKKKGKSEETKVNTENKKEKKVKEKPYQKETDDIFVLPDVSAQHIFYKKAFQVIIKSRI